MDIDDDCVDLDDDGDDNMFKNYVKRDGDDDLIAENEVVTGGRKYDLSITYDFWH